MEQADYKMVLASNSSHLEEQVTALLREGYKVHGSPIYKEGDQAFHKHTMWAQAVVKMY